MTPALEPADVELVKRHDDVSMEVIHRYVRRLLHDSETQYRSWLDRHYAECGFPRAALRTASGDGDGR